MRLLRASTVTFKSALSSTRPARVQIRTPTLETLSRDFPKTTYSRVMSTKSGSSSPIASSSSAAILPTTPPQPQVTFPVSPIPKNPLGEGKYIRTAAALIIGDEILNGKTLDRNSHCFAQYCFEHGVDLKRIEVIADNEEEIIEASRRLVSMYDFVITSGGIGPTHDDITYECLAKSFNQKLVHHQETIRRMKEMSKYRKWVGTQNAEQLAATHRMALFPEDAEIIYVETDIWVPVVRLEGKICIFPGIPALFTKMLYGLTPFIPLPPKNERPLRIQIFTDRPESMIAPYLTSLQERLKPHGIQVGSYPVLYKGVFVSLIGRDLDSKGDGNKGAGKLWLADVAREVEQEIGGRISSEEEIAAQKRESEIMAKSASPSRKNSLGPDGAHNSENSVASPEGKAKF
ncbi:MoaB/Mog domain-containing protein [Crassisporium funariophilum]|nr:MoaB/Mog domain-containing protein [Crassisporium funariophilum]